jgi:ABC-type enterochelin transport system permease subunit
MMLVMNVLCSHMHSLDIKAWLNPNSSHQSLFHLREPELEFMTLTRLSRTVAIIDAVRNQNAGLVIKNDIIPSPDLPRLENI